MKIIIFVSWALQKYQFNETGGVDTETKTKQGFGIERIEWWGSEKENIRNHWQELKS